MEKQPSSIAKIDYGIHVFFFSLMMIVCIIQSTEQEMLAAIAFLFTGLYQIMANFFKLFTVKGARRKLLHLYWLLTVVYLGLFFVFATGLIEATLPQGVYLLFITGAFCLSLLSLYISHEGVYPN